MSEGGADDVADVATGGGVGVDVATDVAGVAVVAVVADDDPSLIRLLLTMPWAVIPQSLMPLRLTLPPLMLVLSPRQSGSK